MRRLTIGPLLVLPFLSLPLLLGTEVLAETQPPLDFEHDVLDFLDVYCLHCHEGSGAEANLDFGRHFTADEARKEPELYWEAAWKVWDHAMPPPRRAEQPTARQRARFLAWIDAEDGLGYRPQPSPAVNPRMNRSIYRRSVLDLCGVEVPEEVLATLPEDEAGDGFDNIGSSLTLADDAVLRYLEAAEAIAALAVVDLEPELALHRWAGNELQAPNYTAASAALWSRGEAFAEATVPRDGRYRLRVGAWGDQAGEEPCRMAVTVDSKVEKEVAVEASFGTETETQLTLNLEKGSHRFAASFLNDYWRPDAPEGTPKDRNLYVGWMELEGPLDAAAPTEFQLGIARSIHAQADAEVEGLALRSMVHELMTRAWRRPPTPSEQQRYVDVVALSETWDDAVRLALTAILTSPNFLFASTSRTDGTNPLEPSRLSGPELSTRLSFFLWSTIPDATLLEAASDPGFTRDEAAILAQVERMLADPRHQALAEDFAEQCFRIRGLDVHEWDSELFPHMDQALLQSMQQETRMLFLDVLGADRDLRDLLTSEDTFLDRRLAEHYGWEWPEQERGWQRFDLSGTQRRGILGHASVLTMTSMATRTSPVRRGKWILENLLGSPPPPPPADAGLLDDSASSTKEATLKERLAIHRSKPQCISCHKVMDPLGFSLEHFDAVGQWRDDIGGFPVDTEGELPDGTRLSGLEDLIQALDAKDGFTRLLVKRLVGYALGRTLGPADRSMIQGILDGLDPEHPTLRQVIQAIVLSDAFLMHDVTPMEETIR